MSREEFCGEIAQKFRSKSTKFQLALYSASGHSIPIESLAEINLDDFIVAMPMWFEAEDPQRFEHRGNSSVQNARPPNSPRANPNANISPPAYQSNGTAAAQSVKKPPPRQSMNNKFPSLETLADELEIPKLYRAIEQGMTTAEVFEMKFSTMQQQFELTPDEYFALKSYKKAHNFD
jgi:hypothetical protein